MSEGESVRTIARKRERIKETETHASKQPNGVSGFGFRGERGFSRV